MVRIRALVCAAIAVVFAISSGPALGVEKVVFTDADATVRIISRNDRDVDNRITPRGTDTPDGMDPQDPAEEFVDYQYIRVHDQNALDTGYWHFNLSGIPAGAEITSAKFQLDLQTNSWGDTSVTVAAITDPNQDWDLTTLPENEINGLNAPFADTEAFPWTGDPDVDGAQRFNAPLPFLDEGDNPADEVRLLVPEAEFFIPIDNQDPFTEGLEADRDGNAYGGFAGGDPGSGGSADRSSNVWPVKDAVDLDITDLVKWKLGQNAAYSDFDPIDTELTVMVRTEIGAGTNGFARFISKESVDNPDINLSPDGEPPLLPGRILISFEGGFPVGDFNENNVLDLPDINDLTAQSAGGTNPAKYDLNGDSLVDSSDVNMWVEDLFKTWIGDADLDGEFNTADLVSVLASGTYEQDVDSVWSEGDFNGSGRTDSGDLVAALAGGGYEVGPRAATAAIPEPSTLGMIAIGAAALGMFRRRRR